MIFFYNKNTDVIYSYVAYTLEYDGETVLNKPSVQQCSQNNNVAEGDIGIAEFLIENPTHADFKDDITDLTITTEYKLL